MITLEMKVTHPSNLALRKGIKNEKASEETKDLFRQEQIGKLIIDVPKEETTTTTITSSTEAETTTTTTSSTEAETTTVIPTTTTI